jgi:protein O-mannosyl-transferase
MTKVVSGPKTVPLWLYVLLVVAITIVAYMRVLSSDFISWDDPELLLHNKDVQHFDIGAFFTRHYAGNYLPVTMLLYALDWSLFQASPAGHHLCNVLLHCLNGVLVFILTYRLFRNEWKAIACMVIFCLHPLQVEPVAWVAEAKTLVCTFFFLLALIFYTRYLHQKKPGILFGSASLRLFACRFACSV